MLTTVPPCNLQCWYCILQVPCMSCSPPPPPYLDLIQVVPGILSKISTSHLLTVHHHPRQHLNASYLHVRFWGSFSLASFACLYPAHRLWHDFRFLLKWYCVCLLGRVWGRGQWQKGWNCWFYQSWHCLQFCFSAFQCIFIKDNVNNMSPFLSEHKKHIRVIPGLHSAMKPYMSYMHDHWLLHFLCLA